MVKGGCHNIFFMCSFSVPKSSLRHYLLNSHTSWLLSGFWINTCHLNICIISWLQKHEGALRYLNKLTGLLQKKPSCCSVGTPVAGFGSLCYIHTKLKKNKENDDKLDYGLHMSLYLLISKYKKKISLLPGCCYVICYSHD